MLPTFPLFELSAGIPYMTVLNKECQGGKEGVREENKECSGRQQELINGPSSLARKDHLIRQLPMKSESGDYLGHWNLCLLIIEACENNSCFVISNRPTSLWCT